VPLLVPGTTAPPLPPPPPVPTPTPTPEPSLAGLSVTTLTDPSGFMWYLDGSMGIWVTPGRRGFHAPSYDFWEDVSPAVDGAFFRGARAPVRELFVPLFFTRPDRSALTTLRRSFAAATSPKRGECVLSVAQPDGTVRHIAVYRGEGMEGEEGEGQWGVTAMRYGLVLRAFDPFFYGDDVALSWSGVATQTFFPLVHSSTNFVILLPSQVLGSTTADNVGDVEAYPRWEISGPASAITLANVTTGKTLTLTSSLAGTSNKRLVDTRPGQATITDESLVNKWAELSAGSSLWPLVPGANALTVSVSGSTSATVARMTYRPRFEGV
jgi:phage-related protein